MTAPCSLPETADEERHGHPTDEESANLQKGSSRPDVPFARSHDGGLVPCLARGLLPEVRREHEDDKTSDQVCPSHGAIIASGLRGAVIDGHGPMVPHGEVGRVRPHRPDVRTLPAPSMRERAGFGVGLRDGIDRVAVGG